MSTNKAKIAAIFLSIGKIYRGSETGRITLKINDSEQHQCRYPYGSTAPGESFYGKR